MKRFLVKTLSFFVLLALLAVAMDIPYSKIMERSNYYQCESWYDVMHGNIQADVVAMGNSRTLFHVDPRILDSILKVNTYNLGMDGSPIQRQTIKYAMLRGKNKIPKLIIQNIDYNSLTYRQGYAREQFLAYFYDKEFRKALFPLEHFSFAEKYIPLYRYKGYNPGRFIKSQPRTLYKGYYEKNAKWNGDAYLKQDSISFCVNDTTQIEFEKYLTTAKNDGTKVVFVYAPIYIGATKKMTNLSEMYQHYQAIADKYEIPILDYTNMGICHDTTYFYNAMHLNSTGSRIYSDSLANDIIKLGIL